MSRDPAEPLLARRLRGLSWTRVAGVEVPEADRYPARLLGLAGIRRERAGAGLLLPGCRSVHTVGMRFEIDVVFLDDAGGVLRTEARVGPGRFLADRRARAVLELPSPR
jgi:hypothetical protein